MTVMEEILEALQLAPVVVGLFQQLLTLFGNKDVAKAVTMAAIAHPSLSPNVALLLQGTVTEAHVLATNTVKSS
ncbi:MAG TPA: hypothetical protein VN924_24615 [Bryobacteraceae bacterium]|jgi:hypothetical protein|nr:hypothetical protein [Bryobacteraceae bacterium]